MSSTFVILIISREVVIITHQWYLPSFQLFSEHQLAQVDMIDRSLAWAYGNDLISDEFKEPATMASKFIFSFYLYKKYLTCNGDYSQNMPFKFFIYSFISP